MRKTAIYILNIMLVFLLIACGKKAEEPETVTESVAQENKEETESRYYIAELQQANDETEYGNIKQEHEEFRNEDGSSFFYYDMDCFYFNEDYPAVLNETLQAYYNGKKDGYRQDAEVYAGEQPYEGYEDGDPHKPYDRLVFQYVAYAADDYVSLVFNDVVYMGGAHPYSAFDGVTIDCGTGEIVTVDRFLDDTQEEIGEQIKTVSGADVFNPKEWDFYITDREVVFFYYDPGFGDPVATERIR
ncbi:MAG: DUF4163 domain-containing protein [Alistipes sp.]|nr:DUF4163 domain-containing protein [Alistipes sp.]